MLGQCRRGGEIGFDAVDVHSEAHRLSVMWGPEGGRGSRVLDLADVAMGARRTDRAWAYGEPAAAVDEEIGVDDLVARLGVPPGWSPE